MSRNSRKASLTVKTAVVMLVMYISVMLTATWFVQNQAFNIHEAGNTDEILSDLKTCRTVEPESAAYVDGFNQAEAFRLMRYHQYKIFEKYHKYNGEVSVNLIKTEVEDGKVISAELMKPATPMLIGLPYLRNSRNIVFADAFSDEQVEEIAELARSGDFAGYIDSLSGYQNGRFFYPDKITLTLPGDSEEEITLAGDPPKTGIRIKNTDTQDFSIYLPDGSRHGSYGLEGDMSDEFAKTAYEMTADSLVGENIGDSDNYTWTTGGTGRWIETAGNIKHLFGDNYLLAVTIQMNPWLYAYDQLKLFYAAGLLIFILAAGAVVLMQNDEIGDRIENERLRRLMTDSLAHDMKTPLSVIRSCSEMLCDETDGKQREYAETIVNESVRMNDRIVSMLDMSKMNAGTYPMDISDFDLEPLIRDIIAKHHALIESKEMSVRMNVENSIRLYADRRLVGIAISNYLTNAVKYGTAGTEINVAAENSNGNVLISVRNIGNNVPPDEIGRIWEAGYRGSASGRGSGIGLAATKSICDLHGGSSGCYPDDNGMTFWLKLGSQENRIGSIDLKTGPVRGVLKGSALSRGVIAVIAGALIQGIFGAGMIQNLYGFILEPGLIYDYGLMVPSDIIAYIGAVAGTLFILYGQYQLNSTGKRHRLNLVMSYAQIVCFTATLIMCGIHLHGSYEGTDDLLHAVAAVTTVVMIAELIANCRMISDIFRDAISARTGRRLSNVSVFITLMCIVLVIAASNIAGFVPFGILKTAWLVITVLAALPWWINVRKIY